MLAQMVKVKTRIVVFPVISHNNSSIYLMIIYMTGYLFKFSILLYILSHFYPRSRISRQGLTGIS